MVFIHTVDMLVLLLISFTGLYSQVNSVFFLAIGHLLHHWLASKIQIYVLHDKLSTALNFSEFSCHIAQSVRETLT